MGQFSIGGVGQFSIGANTLAGLVGWTAMQLVQAGKAQEVLGYIDAVDAGVSA